MLYSDFDNFRLSLLQASGNLTWLMAQKIANDVRSEDNNIPSYLKDLYQIYVLNRYIDIFMDYNPVASGQPDTNFFPATANAQGVIAPWTMLEFQRRINSILNMDWNLSFILTS